jgi:hypothetical protein
VALVTLCLLVDFGAALEALGRGLDLALQQELLLGGVVREVLAEALDVIHQLPDLRVAQEVAPGGHGGPRHAVADDPEQVLVGRQLSLRRPTDLVDPPPEVARAGVEQVGHHALRVAFLAVTLRAELFVERLPGGQVLRRGLARARRAELEAPRREVLRQGEAGQQNRAGEQEDPSACARHQWSQVRGVEPEAA